MPFDPTKPAPGTKPNSAEIRANFTALKAQADDLQTQIAAIPAGPPGPQGPQGDPGPMPPTNPFIAQGSVLAHGGDLGLITSDPNGSGEEGLRLRNNAGRIQIAVRTSGADQSAETLDLAGSTDGGGTPTAQHEDRLVRDGASALWKPARRLGTLFADLTPLTASISDPPTQTEVQENRDRLNEILTRLQAM